MPPARVDLSSFARRGKHLTSWRRKCITCDVSQVMTFPSGSTGARILASASRRWFSPAACPTSRYRAWRTAAASPIAPCTGTSRPASRCSTDWSSRWPRQWPRPAAPPRSRPSKTCPAPSHATSICSPTRSPWPRRRSGSAWDHDRERGPSPAHRCRLGGGRATGPHR